MPQELENWSSQIREGNVRALSRAISAVENHDPVAEDLLEKLSASSGNALVIGVTGAPGTGKSTLVDRLAAQYRSNGKTVGIIAVDPSSPYTGGAILGDRIRMQGHADDAGVFVRSMATRGFLGGLAAATTDVALLLSAAGKEVIFIETVGVGQGEIDVVRMADVTLAVLVPGLGDDIQSMKAGLMEVADIFVINKAEREGAEQLEQQIQAMLHLSSGTEDHVPPVVRTIATEGHGIKELTGAIDAFSSNGGPGHHHGTRQTELWKRRLITMASERLVDRILRSSEKDSTLDLLAGEVARREKTPRAAVQELLARASVNVTESNE